MIASKKEIGPGAFEVLLRDTPNTSDSYRLFQTKNIIRDIKETVCRVSDSQFSEEANANMPSVPYELPDGHSIDLGTERYKIPELIFNPSSLNQKKKEGEDEYLSLPTMVYNSMSKCDPDIRRELSNSMIVTGGTSLIPNFSERLQKELSDKGAPQAYKIKLLATSTPIERKFSVWIGGSILASLGTFQQLWISKAEYEEHGRLIVERKCP